MSIFKAIGEKIGRDAARKALESFDWDRAIDEAIERAVRKEMEATTDYVSFIKAGQLYIMENSDCSWSEAGQHFTSARREIGVRFGAPGHDWSPASARQIAAEYMSSYFEQEAG